MERRELITAAGAGGLVGGVIGFATGSLSRTSSEQQADFELSDYSAPREIQLGDGVEITYTVRNTGTASGTIPLTLQTIHRENGIVVFVGQQTVSLDPNSEKSVTFRHQPRPAGKHLYRLEGFKTIIQVIVRG